MIQAVVSGQLQDTPQLYAHLNRCLGCRACERACPSTVKYGRLIDGIQAIKSRQQPAIKRWVKNQALKLLTKPLLLSVGAGLLQQLPRQPFSSGRLQRLAELCPAFSRLVKWQTIYPAVGERVGRVALFLGCISRFSDQAALQSAVKLLNHLGWEVVVPPKQVCCGALFQHAGEPVTAQKLKAQNQAAFGNPPIEAILTIASGCNAHIREHGELAAPVFDISDFLNRLSWPEAVTFKPLPQQVAVHNACSLRTVDAIYPLLSQIPDITLTPLAGNTICCGAGGTNLITEPEMADALLAPKLTNLKTCQATILLTSNTSCRLHFAAGIRKAGVDIEVLHPVQLLERQLSCNDNPTG